MSSQNFLSRSRLFFKRFVTLRQGLSLYKPNLIALMNSCTFPQEILNKRKEFEFRLGDYYILNSSRSQENKESELKEKKSQESKEKSSEKSHESKEKTQQKGSKSEELTEQEREALSKAGKEAASARWGKDYETKEEKEISEEEVHEARSKIGKMGAEKRWHEGESHEAKGKSEKDPGLTGKSSTEEATHQKRDTHKKPATSQSAEELHEKRVKAGKMGAEKRWGKTYEHEEGKAKTTTQQSHKKSSESHLKGGDGLDD